MTPIAGVRFPSMIRGKLSIERDMSVPLNIGRGLTIPPDTGCAQAGMWANASPPPASAAPLSIRRRSIILVIAFSTSSSEIPIDLDTRTGPSPLSVS